MMEIRYTVEEGGKIRKFGPLEESLDALEIRLAYGRVNDPMAIQGKKYIQLADHTFVHTVLIYQDDMLEWRFDFDSGKFIKHTKGKVEIKLQDTFHVTTQNGTEDFLVTSSGKDPVTGKYIIKLRAFALPSSVIGEFINIEVN